MSDADVETQGVDDNGASGTPTDVTEEPMTDEVVEEVVEPEMADVEPDPVVVEAEVTEDTRPGLEPDREDDKKPEAEKKNTALDRKLTKENSSLRKRLREVESALKAREEAELSEQERQARRLKELEEKYTSAEQRLRESALHLSVSSEASRLNIVDPDAAVKLIDTSTLEYDEEENKWDGISEALSVLVEDKPWLVRPAQTPAAKESSPANPARRRTRLTREALGKMSQAEIDALPKEDIYAALAST